MNKIRPGKIRMEKPGKDSAGKILVKKQNFLLPNVHGYGNIVTLVVLLRTFSSVG